MSCNGDLERICREHVFSLQPTPGEADDFRKLNAGLLAANATWPPLLTNYLHRYMHSHNLYQVLKSKPEKLSNLVAFLGSRAGLSEAEDIVKKLTQKCTSLIIAYGQQWKRDGLLVSGGTCLRKSKTLRQVWASHSDLFGRVEIRHHWGFAEMPDPTSMGLPPSFCPRKRTTDSIVPEDAKKLCPDHEPMLSRTVIEDTQLNPDGAQSIGEREMTEPDHGLQCPQTDNAHDTIVLEHAAGHLADRPLVFNSPLQPNESRDNKQLDHIAQETLDAVQQIERQRQTPPPTVGLAVQHEASPSCLSAPRPIQRALGEAGASLSNLAENPHPRKGHPVAGQIPKNGSTTSEKPTPLSRTQPGISGGILYSPRPQPPQKMGLAASLEYAVDTCPETAFGASQFSLPKDRQLALRKLKLLGQLLVPQRDGSGPWLMDVDDLMLQDLNKFCGYISQITGLPKGLALRFELLDLNTSCYIICKGDLQAFHNLKLAILDGLLVGLNANPGLANFRILVTIPYKKKGAQALGVTPLGQPPATGTPPARLDSTPLIGNSEKVLRSHLSERGSSYSSAGSQTQIVVRIQQTGGAFSPRYQKAILGPGVTNKRFFAWIAKKIGHHDPLGPLGLEFCFKDALPPKRSVIARGNEEHFDCMKRDIDHLCEQTAAQVPELFEFTILVISCK